MSFEYVLSMPSINWLLPSPPHITRTKHTAPVRRKLSDLTVGPVLTWTTDAMLAHVDKLLALPGARILFGGKQLTGHSIPPVYGAIQPTAVFVPLDAMLASDAAFELVTTEIFGPFQVLCLPG